MKHKIEEGFSLIELLVALLLNVIILIAVYDILTTGQKLYVTQEETMAGQQQARVAMDTITRFIRSSGSDPMQTAFNVATGTVHIALAQPNSLEVLADLPQDLWDDGCTGAAGDNPDGDTFDSCDEDSDDVWDDDENENGDGVLNDPDEDVTFFLAPNDGSAELVPTGSGPWTLIKRVTIDETMEDIPLVSNVMSADGSAGLQFRYILKFNGADPNLDTISLPFPGRWNGDSGSAASAENYTALGDRRLITRILVRLTVRSNQRDRITRDFRYITLEEDVDIRTKF